jgi:tRNA U34 5-carboxymethylaminomethyl modifying enzyme MnmG/GidA
MAQATTSGESWDLEADVVIIGSGAAGLPAAIKAADAGASVINVSISYVSTADTVSAINYAAGRGAFIVWAAAPARKKNMAYKTQRTRFSPISPTGRSCSLMAGRITVITIGK